MKNLTTGNIEVFDTETVNRPGAGYACLLAKSLNKDVLLSDFPKSFDQIFNFLASRQTQKYVCWNMDFDARAICHPHFLPELKLVRLAMRGYAEMSGYKIRYVPRKVLEVRKDKKGFILYDLMQFYGFSLKEASNKFGLKQGKKEIPQAWYSQMDMRLCDPKTRYRLFDYAVSDVLAVKSLLERLVYSMGALGIYTDKLASCASLARVRFRIRLRAQNIDSHHNHFFKKAFYGGRIETGILGRVGPCKLYDINSAYPSEIAKLRDIREAAWETFEDDWRERGADYGAYWIKVNVPKSFLWGPLAYRHKNKVIYPVGEFKTWCARPGLETLMRHKIPFKVLRARELFLPENADILFPEIESMYEARKKSDVDLAIKLSLSSLYGLMAEQKDYYQEDAFNGRIAGGIRYKRLGLFGKLTNFVFASHITEAIRMKIWEIMHREKGKIYFAATDGLLTSNRVNLPLSEKMGAWALKSAHTSGVILGCGRYWLDAEKPIYHLRGFPVKEEIFKTLKKCDKPFALIPFLDSSSMRQWALNPHADFNVLLTMKKILEIKDDKRYWLSNFVKIKDAWVKTVKSEPWILWEDKKYDRETKRTKTGHPPGGK